MDLPSVLGGLAQGFTDFGKSVVDLFGTGGAAIGDLLQGTGTRNQDDFRKWLYNTNSVQDAAAKGLGTALNGVQTVSDYIPGINVLTRNPLGNAAQGALGGLADEFKMNGENYDLGRAGQRAAVSGAAALAGSSLGDALKKSANPLLQSGLAQGLARGAAGGAINQGGYAAIDGGDVWNSALQGAGMGALLGGATGAMQDFRPNKVYDMPLTDEEKALRISNAQKQIDDIGPVSRFSNNPDDIAKRARITELQGTIKAYQSGYDTVQDYNDAMAAKRANRANTQSATTTQGQVYAPNMGEMEYGAPVQEGYTRLYRGITQEFDPQYNRNAMDNMNGYESWTDSYDLANRYGGGKYVYSIDVPTSQIANSIYDENPNSATYGDRNFIAAIEKAAGLDGINGNEYLLNTNDELRSGLTYNRVNTPKALGTTLADADMAVNAVREPEGFTYDYDGSDLAAVQRAYNLATQDQVKLDGILKEISDTLGTDFESAGQKSVKSMLDKIERKVRSGRDYTVSSMKDHTRGKVMMHNFSEIPQVLQELDRRGVPYDTEVVTNDWGYKGYHITYRNPDGISSEIQLTTADHWPAKLESDAIYDEWRNFNLDASTKTERQRYNEAMAKSQALWAKVDFSDFDKTVQSLSDTGRASRSVAPVTSKLGLTQEPSLYTKMPSSSESASMSPSSVTRTFSGTGFDKSPNIDTPPFMDIIPQNTSRTLEGVLSADDLKVNSAKIAPGESLSIEPNEKTKRAIEIIQQAGDWGRPVENELYNRIDASTLPEGYDRLRRYLDDKEYIFNTVNEKIGADNVFDADADKMLDFLYPKEPQEKKVYYKSLKESIEKYKRDAAALGLDASDAERRVTLQKKSDLFDKVVDRVKFDAQAEMGRDINLSDDVIQAMSDPEHRGIRTGYPGALDTILSERLGIAPGNTIKISDARFDYADDMSDFFNGQPANGRYMKYGKDISIRNTPDTEGAVSTMAHERLHSFQNESTPENIGRYSKEVTDAYKELSKDLKPFIKDWNDIREIHKGYKTDYYSKPIEQESRMLQQYLDNKGITDGAMFWRNKALEGGKPEWGNEINPAFDKFFDKLRDLSKRGVALPALAGLLGGGVVLDQVLNSKDSDKDKKKTKRSA